MTKVVTIQNLEELEYLVSNKDLNLLQEIEKNKSKLSYTNFV